MSIGHTALCRVKVWSGTYCYLNELVSQHSNRKWTFFCTAMPQMEQGDWKMASYVIYWHVDRWLNGLIHQSAHPPQWKGPTSQVRRRTRHRHLQGKTAMKKTYETKKTKSSPLEDVWIQEIQVLTWSTHAQLVSYCLNWWACESPLGFVTGMIT